MVEIPKWRTWAGRIVLGVIVLAGLIFGWKTFFYHAPPTGIYNTTPPAAGMPAEPTKPVTISVPLKVYDKKQAAKKMALPAAIVSDPRKELVATGRIKVPDSDFVPTVAAITDTSTGITTLETKVDRPVLGIGGASSAGALVGISNRGQTVLGYIGQDVLRIGPAKIGVAGGGGMAGTELVYGGFAHVHGSW